ncbi:MAG: dTMP kinase [Alphaproteobacteria bacterium]|nr:dTMP kinase [Alphaproteobacteria bacterium]MBT4020237.1 dTMP kinase [Alphaproteobacteria bacterium]MBT4965858.1 dTMP kinase [Alphaproteobacteria bacterium]MBT5158297.1 dTMP kinase [Alphaproteobacteria bacterium]MBT5919962.1 dTMP kinase [Alphaproteobacteria bacterium]
MTTGQPERGKFITLEGGEGAGKTTQIKSLKNWLNDRNIDVLTTREPGGSEGAEQIRDLLVNGDVARWDAMTETLLHFAARRDHVEKVVKPALEAGKWVISDRFADSTMAYQGYGHGLGIDQIQTIYDTILSSFNTDLTIILDLETEVGLSRAISRSGGEDRYERMDIEFHQRLRQGFLEIAKNAPDRCCVVDAAGDADDVFDQIRAVVQDRLKV